MSFFDWFSHDKKLPQKIEEEKICDFLNFELITEYIYEQSGITDLDKRAIVSNQLKKFAEENGFYTTDYFLEEMKENKAFYQEVINIITVNETYFFREIKELEWLVSHVKTTHRNFSILSMPCSSGEEVYSILIMLSEANVDISTISITGFDINSEAVKRAQKGRYDERALHKLPLHVKEKYFTCDDEGHYFVVDRIKKRANFFQNNIFELSNHNEYYDIVLSRNMFIYFDMQKRLHATNIIVDLLKHEGIYIKGHADYIQEHKNLKNITFGVYKKV